MKPPYPLLLGLAPPFRLLDPRQLIEVYGLAEVRSLHGGTVLFDEGQPATRFHLLLSGHMRVTKLTADGDQVVILHIPAGQMFGIGAALGQVVHHTGATAADACVVLCWPSHLWPAFARSYDGFASEAFRAFAARSDELSTRIVELSTKLVEQRIACALLRMIGQSGRKVAGGVEIGFPVTRQIIADMTGTTLHTVSRILSQWERRDVVKSTRCLIMVTDPHSLLVLSGATDDVPPARTAARIRSLPPAA